jgi:hypothetical protein
LEREPLQIDAEVWGLIDKFQDTYALVLSDAQDDPIEITGAGLRTMRDGGQLTLYPATYRLVYDEDHKSGEVANAGRARRVKEMDNT